ncbi:hypothetical protein [Actinocorallia aurea]
MRTATSKRAAARSLLAARMLDDLMSMRPALRRATIAEIPADALAEILAVSWEKHGTVYHLWVDDPVGFVTLVLGETMWSKQRDVLAAIPQYSRIAVPAGFGLGKTHLAARAATWFCCVRPVGTALTVTTATRFRQVRHQLWPHIRKVHARAGLPGDCDTTQWKMPDANGVETVVAYGFSAPEHDEAAMQGIHAAALLLVVDEAGGIGKLVGRSTRNLLTGDARMLAIGNPAADEEDTWFEELCADGLKDDEPDTVLVRIAATDSPSVTGEATQMCTDCASGEPHPLSKHLVDPKWIAGAIRDHGEKAPYVIAKVHAEFPKGGSLQILPSAWVDAAAQAVEPEGPGWVRLCDLGLAGEDEAWMVKRGAWVRLGVDVAADGGDELVIARSVGDLVTIQHIASGSANAEATDVAKAVWEEMKKARALAHALGTRAVIRVKVDANGVGWGVVSILKELVRTDKAGPARWGVSFEVVKVMVSESPGHEPDSQTMRPYRKRDEMWLAVRSLLAPAAPQGLRLRVDTKALAQLRTPRYSTNSGGFIVVESKDSMKARGVPSPDRGDAVCLLVYEPEPLQKRPTLIV